MVDVTFVSFVSGDNEVMSPQLPIATFGVAEPEMELTVDTRALTSPGCQRVRIGQVDAGANLSFTAAQKSHYFI